MFSFPKQFILEDTGERRYPKVKEWYSFEGQDPLIHEGYEDEFEWSDAPSHYAIYKKVEVKW